MEKLMTQPYLVITSWPNLDGARLQALQHEIESAHPYAVAEILQFKIDSGNREYLDWIKLSTQ